MHTKVCVNRNTICSLPGWFPPRTSFFLKREIFIDNLASLFVVTRQVPASNHSILNDMVQNLIQNRATKLTFIIQSLYLHLS